MIRVERRTCVVEINTHKRHILFIVLIYITTKFASIRVPNPLQHKTFCWAQVCAQFFCYIIVIMDAHPRNTWYTCNIIKGKHNTYKSAQLFIGHIIQDEPQINLAALSHMLLVWYTRDKRARCISYSAQNKHQMWVKSKWVCRVVY